MSDTPPQANHPTPNQSPTPTPLTHQLNREAKWSIYLTLLYMAGWVIFAYFMPTGTGVLGLPLWFELSCVFLPLIFILISMAVLKVVYKEMDLDTDLTSDNGENA
ncbi:Predicted membrane protein [Moraxella lacunata]|uniref:Predicted membrane protein n=1 Tax=Moraxella lacunata TaxID=477 RepID=A0A378T602_MORLA|nr:YhdT family protein [Moraxella lacunata]STZ55824.1 Predicted membrane protein [Moraxella lacunata]